MKENHAYEDNFGEEKLPDFRSENPFTLPENYFEQAADHIKTVCKLATHVGPNNEVNPAIPTGYFEELTTKINSRIFLAQNISKEDTGGFEIPRDYFLESAEQILASARLESQRSTVHAEGGFAVPEGYFHRMSDQIFQRIQLAEEEPSLADQPAGKVVPLRRRWIPYAAAASLLFVLSVSAYLGLNEEASLNPVAQRAVAEPSLEAITDDELVEYLALSDDHHDEEYFVKYIYEEEENVVEKACSTLEDQELEAYIKHML